MEDNKGVMRRLMVLLATFVICIGATKADENIVSIYNQYHKSLKEFRTNHDYEKGIEAGEKYLKDIEKAENGKKKHYSLILTGISYLYDESGNHKKAIEYAHEAADIQLKELSDTSDFYLASLTRLANFYSHDDQYGNAISAAEKIRDIYIRLGRTNTRDYAIITGNIATYYNKLDNPKKAIELHTEALNVIEQIQGRDSKDYADRLAMLSMPLFKIGQCEKAIQNVKEAISILENVVGRNNRGYMTYVNNLSQMQSLVGEYVDAMILMGEAMDICETLYGTQSPDYASYLNNYGNLQAKLGKYRDALQSFSQALEIKKSIYGMDHSDVGITLGSIGSYYSNLGEYTEAIRTKKEALEVFERSIGKESVLYAKTLMNIATDYYWLGNNYEANKNMTEAARIISEKLGENSVEYARILLSKAALDVKMGNCSDAIAQDDIVLEIFKNTLGERNNEYATALHNKSNHLASSKQYTEAIALGEQVLKLREDILGRLHDSYATTLHNLGNFHAETGNFKQGGEYVQKALSIYENIYGRKNPRYINSLARLCEMYLGSENYNSAALYVTRCNDLITDQVMRMFMDLTSHERSLVWSNYSKWFSNTIPQIAYHTNRKPVIQSAYNALLFSKSLLLNTEIELMNLIAEEGNKDDIKLYQSIMDARRQLTKVYEMPLEQQKSRTDSLELYIKDSETVLLQRSKAYGDYTKKLCVTWDDVRRSLGSKDIAIEFSAFHNVSESFGADTMKYVAFVIKPDYEAPVIVPICKIPYNKNLFAKDDYLDVDKGNVDVWSSLASVLDGVENIYFAPTAELYDNPIEYLPYYGDDSKTMSDVFSIRRLSSTREIALQSKTTGSPIVTASLYGGLSYRGLVDNEKRSVLQDDDDNLNVLRDSFGPLTETKTEIENISRYLGQMNVKYEMFTDSVGTESSFRQLSKKNISLLHVATHGFYWTAKDVEKYNFKGFLNPNRFANFSDEDKALARSGILLAGAETTFRSLSDNFDPDDGIVTAKEIAQLDFRGMDLAVLSACQTGLGDISTDGVFGLQRGFKKAGVQSLLMSLWKVDDKATQILMSNFYKGLSDGLSKVEALKSAQKFLREYEVEEEYDENDSLTASQRRRIQNSEGELVADIKLRKVKPYSSAMYWAAFVLLDALN